jgi:hypothetical protein
MFVSSFLRMDTVQRHQCLIYEGAPSRQLSVLAAATRDKLREGYRCLCLNSPAMIAGMRSYLAAAGVDVELALADTSLVLSADRKHLLDGRFDVDRMIAMLEDAFQTLRDGFAGFWATGDMSWEIGPCGDFSRLLEYEWRLDEFFRDHPEISGICQYRVDTLPHSAVRQAILSHHSLFVNETLSLLNPRAVGREAFREGMAEHPELDAVAKRLCRATGPTEPTDAA